MEVFKEESQNGLQYDEGEDANTAAVEIVKGTEVFVTDIAEFTPIPTAVETFVKIDITGHPLVKEVGGTIDYYSKEQATIADVKTSKRKPTISNYVVQQSIYKHLAEANDMPVRHNLIQSVVLAKREVSGSVLALEPQVDKAKYLVNHMLDKLEIVAKDIVPIEVLLPGNPGYYLCSGKYCAHYSTCPFVNGNAPAVKQQAIQL